MKNVVEIKDLAGLKAYAAELATSLPERQIILLVGPMGAGKTQFTRFVLEALGCDETVSPTFAIHNQYDSSRGPVDHVDLFRLEDEEDLESTGFWDLFSEPRGLVIIEWPERLPQGSLPRSWPQTHLSFEVTGPTSRRITRR